MKEDNKKNRKLSSIRKSEFEKTSNKCPKISISDKKVIELKNEDKK